MRTTQDDARENKQIELFGIAPSQGRTNKYIHDGTITVQDKIYPIELKTWDTKRRMVSTARNVTLKKIDEWKQVYWILSEYEKMPAGFKFTGEHYFMSAKQLKSWFDKQEKKILAGTKFYGGLNDWRNVKNILRENNVPNSTIDRLSNSFMNRVCGLNDPRIPWKYIKDHGTKINNNKLKDHVRELLLKA